MFPFLKQDGVNRFFLSFFLINCFHAHSENKVVFLKTLSCKDLNFLNFT